MSAAMTVLLGEADKHQSVRMGVDHNINMLFRRARESRDAQTWSTLVGGGGGLGGLCTWWLRVSPIHV